MLSKSILKFLKYLSCLLAGFHNRFFILYGLGETLSHRLNSKPVLLHVQLVPYLHEIAKDTLFYVVNGKLPEYNGLPLFQTNRHFSIVSAEMC